MKNNDPKTLKPNDLIFGGDRNAVICIIYRRNILNFIPSIFILFLFLFCTSENASAQTIVANNVSGTWTIEGSPYLLINDCTVQTGTELIIEPGVEISIGDSMSLNVYGKITAIGTSNQHIIFKTTNDSIKFNQVYVQNGSSEPPVSEFKYCEFKNAKTGLYIHAYGRIINDYTTMQTYVSNCIFENSVSTAIYVRAQAVDYSQYMSPRRGHARVNPVISGCIFNGNVLGIEMYIQGAGSAWYSGGNTAAIIQNNLFLNLTEAAISMLPGTLNSGNPSFVNNTIVNCERGVWIQDGDFDATTINNIFYGTTTAIERTGDNSSTTFYNCFYDNEVNFAGYPVTYGSIVMSNRNGEPCDLGQNIFQDPLLTSSNYYNLLPDSPCLNAGIDSIDSNENWYFAPSTDFDGNSRPNPTGSSPDIGAFESASLPTIIKVIDSEIPPHFALYGNYPNPFKRLTTISFQVPKLSYVNISIYDINGHILETILNDKVEPGYHTIDWNGDHYSSGIYYYKVTAAQFSATGNCILAK